MATGRAEPGGDGQRRGRGRGAGGERGAGGRHSQVQPDLLEGHELARVPVPGLVHHPVGALADLLHLLEHVHAGAPRPWPPGSAPPHLRDRVGSGAAPRPAAVPPREGAGSATGRGRAQTSRLRAARPGARSGQRGPRGGWRAARVARGRVRGSRAPGAAAPPSAAAPGRGPGPPSAVAGPPPRAEPRPPASRAPTWAGAPSWAGPPPRPRRPGRPPRPARGCASRPRPPHGAPSRRPRRRTTCAESGAFIRGVTARTGRGARGSASGGQPPLLGAAPASSAGRAPGPTGRRAPAGTAAAPPRLVPAAGAAAPPRRSARGPSPRGRLQHRHALSRAPPSRLPPTSAPAPCSAAPRPGRGGGLTATAAPAAPSGGHAGAAGLWKSGQRAPRMQLTGVCVGGPRGVSPPPWAGEGLPAGAWGPPGKAGHCSGGSSRRKEGGLGRALLLGSVHQVLAAPGRSVSGSVF